MNKKTLTQLNNKPRKQKITKLILQREPFEKCKSASQVAIGEIIGLPQLSELG